MKSSRILSLAFFCALSLGVSLQAADTYKIDAVHSSAIFRIKHFEVSYTYGRINNPEGTLVFDAADPSKCSIEVTLKAAAVDTNNEKRDAHLKTPDFLDVEKHPTLSFKSKSVKKDGDAYVITGDFSLLGVTKELTVKAALTGTAKHEKMGERIGFECTFDIKRSDFGMNKFLPGAGDEVRIMVSLEAVKEAAAEK